MDPGRSRPPVEPEIWPNARLGVLGWPVAHSRSPAIQNAALAAVGLADWRYQLLPVPPELFEETVRALPGAGLSRRQRDDPAQGGGARARDRADTAGERDRRREHADLRGDGAIGADNTDAPALIAALPFSAAGTNALVLGAGGSARAAVWALLDAGAREVRVWNRTPERAVALCAELGGAAGRARRAGRSARPLHLERPARRG